MRRDHMNPKNITRGKIVPILLLIIILMACALGVGYYLSQMRFDKKVKTLNEKFDKLESRQEVVTTQLDYEVKKIQVELREKEGQTEEEAKQLKLMSYLLKAKGEIISGKLALANGNGQECMTHIDEAIKVLKDAIEITDENRSEKIESVRLRLATAKGLMEADVEKAQEELDKLWREIDEMIIR